jgi:hypothetical protein
MLQWVGSKFLARSFKLVVSFKFLILLANCMLYNCIVDL